jgi:hypothetical protein
MNESLGVHGTLHTNVLLRETSYCSSGFFSNLMQLKLVKIWPFQYWKSKYWNQIALLHTIDFVSYIFLLTSELFKHMLKAAMQCSDLHRIMLPIVGAQ